MAAYDPEKLLSLWRREQMTPEMALGHILQNMVSLQETLQQLNLLVNRLQAEIDRLAAQCKSR